MHPFGLQAVTPIRLVRHAPGTPGLRWLGLGPRCCPSRALLKLQRLFNRHATWARGKRLVAFGRATSDCFSRAVLWDIVVAGDLQGRGLGRLVVEELPHSPAVAGVERVYLMTTNNAGFYRQLGFRDADPQQLLVRKI